MQNKLLQLKGSITDDELENLHEQKKCKAIEKFKKNIEPTACGSPANWIKDLEQIIEVVLLHFGFFKVIIMEQSTKERSLNFILFLSVSIGTESVPPNHVLFLI